MLSASCTMLLTPVLLALLCAASCHCANILALFPSSFASHRMWARPLLLSLSSRGHHVTVLSSFPEQAPGPNHTDLLLETVGHAGETSFNLLSLSRDSTFNTLLSYYHFMTFIEEQDLLGIASNGTRTLLNSTQHFDLIITDMYHAEFYLGFIHKFNYPPVIVVTSYGINPLGCYALGSPQTPSYIPHVLIPYSHRMSFWQRALNTYLLLRTAWWYHHHQLPLMDALAKQHFGQDVPPLLDLARHVDLMLVNIDFSLDFPRPLVPSIVPVGGMHIMPVKQLPQDLQSYLDSASKGVIVFSLGSAVRSDLMSNATLTAFLDAFSSLPQRVLWKCHAAPPTALPVNVRTQRWIPQSDVLAHKHVVALITHGGLQSIQEALYHAVPMVVLPVYGDQPSNAERVVVGGLGTRLDMATLSKQSVLHAVNSVLHNHSYRTAMRQASALFQDQPQTALDRALFWTDYVLRHKGAPHLRSVSAELPWYQYWSLDIVAALVTVLALVLYVLATVGGRLYRGGGQQAIGKHKVH